MTHDEAREALLSLDDLDGAMERSELEPELSAHLEACPECRGLALSLRALDDGLVGLPRLGPSEDLARRTLERVRALDAEAAELREARQAREGAAGAEPERVADREPGALGVLGALLGALLSGLWDLAKILVYPFWRRRASSGSDRSSRWTRAWMIALPAAAALVIAFVAVRPFETVRSKVSGADAVIDSLSDRSVVVTVPPQGSSVALDGPPVEESGGEGDLGGLALADSTAELRPTDDLSRDAYRFGWDGDGRFAQPAEMERNELDALIDGENTAAPAAPSAGTTSVSPGLDHRGPLVTDEPGPRPTTGGDHGARNDEGRRGEPADLPLRGMLDQGVAENQRAQNRATTPVGDRVSERVDDGYLAERTQLDGLTFQPAEGYWANTYVPGDPAIRLLRRRLADAPGALALARLAEPSSSGLEPPRRGALALSVSADRAEVEGPSRALVAIRLRGAAQRAGRRPTLRVQVVLDLRRPLDEAEQRRVRALLEALSRARDGADRMGVVVAGPHGGTLVEPGELRFGQLTVALQRAFAGGVEEAPALTLEDATRGAIESVGALEDPSSPLGSSLVLLVTPGLDAADAASIERVAHVGALGGVTTSALGLGVAAALEPRENVALAGHGRRYVLGDAAAAERTVQREVEAVSRVVARAVRLRVRLAAGVQLIDVLGSRRLDAAQAERVRQAEQRVDRELARRLGIVSDRGDDEDGIQIVVPAFYADDAHVVLLDVWVPGAGPVLDVQARFKDLLRLGNGTLSERLELPRGNTAGGPAERQVLRAWVGHRIAEALRAAASDLEAGRVERARSRVEATRRRVAGIGVAIPALASDAGQARDLELCDRMMAALDGPASADALRYAAHRRLMGDPLELGEPSARE